MALFEERGYESTTVAEIAQRAGLTERTFFRHFADKREVLFAGSEQLQEFLAERVGQAPDIASPLEAVSDALEEAGALLEQRADWPRRRQTVIAANAELKERELIKLASLASEISDALRSRGVQDPVAVLTAEVGIAAFRVAFDRWVQQPDGKDLPSLIRESLLQLKAVTAGR
jgi:AcrR family transcriptional regulator